MNIFKHKEKTCYNLVFQRLFSSTDKLEPRPRRRATSSRLLFHLHISEQTPLKNEYYKANCGLICFYGHQSTEAQGSERERTRSNNKCNPHIRPQLDPY